MARFAAFHNRRIGSPLSREEVSELAQTSVLALLRKLEQFDGSTSLEGWGSRFCFLELMRHLRDCRYRPHLLPEGVEGTVHEPRSQDSHALLEAGELLLFLEDMDHIHAQPVLLKHLDGLTFEEMSLRLKVPQGTIKARYYSGMDKLRQRFSGSLRVLGEAMP